MKLEEGGVVHLGFNVVCKVHGIGVVGLKIFDDHGLLLHNVGYVPDLGWNLLSISMFDYLGYCTWVEHEVLNISSG